MRRAVVVMTFFLVAAPFAATARPALDQAAKPLVRACVDAVGYQAECGQDPAEAHECRAADVFGACPQAPKCYTLKGARVRCVAPVTPIGEPPRPKP
ncbi:hypothetical protein GCM10010983_18680 [Caulobacter rhizosphaerae]|jgi:hypothetical protein|nr:hypothetical protein GCM10010983_18680 [Caulobacter rhizosphaerae]